MFAVPGGCSWAAAPAGPRLVGRVMSFQSRVRLPFGDSLPPHLLAAFEARCALNGLELREGLVEALEFWLSAPGPGEGEPDAVARDLAERASEALDQGRRDNARVLVTLAHVYFRLGLPPDPGSPMSRTASRGRDAVSPSGLPTPWGPASGTAPESVGVPSCPPRIQHRSASSLKEPE